MNVIKKTFFIHSLTIALIFGFANGESNARITRSIRISKTPSVAEYRLSIKEKGEHFSESMKIDTRENSVLFNVPAHNNVDKSSVLFDYNLNISITRFPDLGICYLKPLDSFDPSRRKLKVDMKLVSTHKPGLRRGIRTVTEEWVIDKLLEPKDLHFSVRKHCGDFPVYRLRKMDEDAVIVKEKQANQTRMKRSATLPFLCNADYPHIKCGPADWYFRCKFAGVNQCIYWVSCKKQVKQIKSLLECDSVHKWSAVLCCDPTCAKPSG